jgi:cell division protein FtsA
MSKDESVLGVAVIDMGGQTSSLSIFKNNSLRYNNFIPVGSNHITNDISIALHTPLNIAESLKRNHGDLIEINDDVLELPIIGDEENKNSIPLKVVQNVIVSRVEETLLILAKFLEKSGLKDSIGAGLVLTGGMTQLKGMREFAQSIFPGYSVRIGVPVQLKGLFDNLKGPENATVIGLILYKAGQHTQYEIDNKKRLLHHKEENYSLKKDFEDTGFINEQIENDLIKTSNESRSNAIEFTDLPGVEESRGDFISRLKNWIKQLF